MNIANSVIVITAAGTLTGRAIAEYFCRLDARIALIDTDNTSLQHTANSCAKFSAKCSTFCLSSRNVEYVKAIFDDITHQMGPIDVLINYWQTGGIPHLLSENTALRHSLADNTSNLYLFGRCAAFCMLDKGRKGVIVNIPSIENKNNENLDGSNAVIKGLTQSWAKELASANIRVAGVIPQLRHIDKGLHRRNSVINYDMIDGAAYIVENDSFTGRMLESIS